VDVFSIPSLSKSNPNELRKKTACLSVTSTLIKPLDMSDHGLAYPDGFVRCILNRDYPEHERTADVAAVIRNELEDHYVRNTAWMLRNAWDCRKEAHALEGTDAANEAVVMIARKVMPLRVLTEMPVWIKEQMYWYVLLLNHLWEICLTSDFDGVKLYDRRANGELSDCDMRTDAMHLIGVLSEPGGIVLHRRYPSRLVAPEPMGQKSAV
jgi:hypothetical protein